MQSEITLTDGRKFLVEHTGPLTDADVPEIIRKATGSLPPSARPGSGTEAALEAARASDEGSWVGPTITTALRVVPPVAGGLAVTAATGGAGWPVGLALATGGAAGELLAEQVEKARGTREALNPVQVAVQAALSTLPGLGPLAKLGPAGRTLARMGYGGLMGGAGMTATQFAEGELPSPGEVAAGVGGGALLGAAIGARAERALRRKALPAPAAEPIPTQAVPKPEAMKPADEIVSTLTTGAPDGILEPHLNLEATKRIADAAAELGPDAFAATQAAAQKQRLFRQLAEIVHEGTVDVETLFKMQERYGLTGPEIGAQLAYTVSFGGRTLRVMRTLRDQLAAIADKNKTAAEILEGINTEATRIGTDSWVAATFRKMDDLSRLAAVGQLATAFRNLNSQGARFSLHNWDVAVQSVLEGQSPKVAIREAAQAYAMLGKQFSKTEMDAIQRILDRFPVEANRLFTHHLGEMVMGNAPGKLAQFLHVPNRMYQFFNIPNRLQENFFRRALFKSTLDRRLREMGYDLQKTYADPDSIPDGLIREATDVALESTYAATATEGVAGALIGLWRNPIGRIVLTTVNPYPRFLGNAWKFIADFNPAGYLRFMGRHAEEHLANPKRAAQIFSRAMTGSFMLSSALAIRQSSLAGPRWFQIAMGPPDPKTGKQDFFDARPFAPYSTFLFMAEAIDQVSKYGTDTNRWTLSAMDVMQGLVSINRIAGTGLVMADLVRGRADIRMRLLGELAGQWLGRLTVPFRTMKDFMMLTHPDEGLFLDTRGGLPEYMELPDGRKLQVANKLGPIDVGRLAAPAMSNLPETMLNLAGIPKLARARSPFRGEVGRRESDLFGRYTGAVRQLTGLSVQRLNPLEREVQQVALQLRSSTGVPQADRIINGIMGTIVSQQLRPTLESKVYKRLDPTYRRLRYLKPAFQNARKIAYDVLWQQHPTLAIKVAMRREDRDMIDMVLRNRPELAPLLAR